MTTPKLSLSPMQPAQAQKHVTVNEALERIDAAVQLSVIGEAVTPPDTVSPGTGFRVAAAATNAFAGHDGEVAVMGAGGWQFFSPKDGWILWDQSEGKHRIWEAGVWRALGEDASTAPRFGINTAADPNNRLSVKADSTLFDTETGSNRVVLNRADQTDTTSLLFQTGYAGQAEIGLTGSADLAIRVSADGTAWSNALRIDASTGQVVFPESDFGSVRRVVLTSGSGSYTPPVGVKSLHILVQGGGGGGAGAENPTVDVMAGAGGGGGGACAMITLTGADLSQSFTYVVGLGGVSGSATAGAATGSRNGGDGGDTQFSGGSVTLIAGGGRGAPEKDARSGHSEFAGGAGGVASGGELNLAGQDGCGGLTAMQDYFVLGSGQGGGSVLGQGGAFNNGNGRPGTGYGGGGAGAGMIPRFVLNRAGGEGTSGCLIITEFF